MSADFFAWRTARILTQSEFDMFSDGPHLISIGLPPATASVIFRQFPGGRVLPINAEELDNKPVWVGDCGNVLLGTEPITWQKLPADYAGPQ